MRSLHGLEMDLDRMLFYIIIIILYFLISTYLLSIIIIIIFNLGDHSFAGLILSSLKFIGPRL